MPKKPTERLKVTPSSGNVFADIGLPEPEDALARAQLATHIEQAIARRRLTRAKAAALMGIDQRTLSALINMPLDKFSCEQMMRFLIKLGQDIDLRIVPSRRTRGKGLIRVTGSVNESA
ncbi:MAG: XRE family transcriptional regulator [Alphaproteobacteria bacterium]|nr:XRE family transcriptional regulator [Alphaproteobacteria bacterium]